MPLHLTASQFTRLRSGKPLKAHARTNKQRFVGPTVNIARVTVPLTPVSVNHYKKLRVVGGHPQHYLTEGAKAFTAAVQQAADGQRVDAKAYFVAFCVFLGHAQKLDIDNAGKQIMDSLVKAGIIHSDAAVTDTRTAKRRDRLNPRTEIIVRAADEKRDQWEWKDW